MSDWYQLQLSRLGMLGFSLFVIRRLFLHHSTLWRFVFLHPWFFWLHTMTLSLGRLREKSTLFLCQISAVYLTRGQWKVHRPNPFSWATYILLRRKTSSRMIFQPRSVKHVFPKNFFSLSKHVCLKRMT